MFKLLPFIWPFVKELMLGNKTLTEAFKDNKKKVFTVALIMASFALNIFVVPKLLTISGQYVILQREHEKLQAQVNELKNTDPMKGRKPVAPVEDPPRVTEKKDEPQRAASSDNVARTSSKARPTVDRVAKARKQFDNMRQQEERE